MDYPEQLQHNETVNIGQDSRWENPFQDYGAESLTAFRDWFYGSSYAAVRYRNRVISQLANKQLVCNCRDRHLCHGIVLREFLGNLPEVGVKTGSGWPVTGEIKDRC